MGLTILYENDTPIEPPTERVTEMKNTDIVEYTNTNKNKVHCKTDMFNIDMIVNNDIVLKDIQHIPVNAQASVVGDDENMYSLEINKTKTDENRDCNSNFYNLFDRKFVVEEKKDGIIEHEITAYADVGLIEDDDEDTVEIDLEIEKSLLREIEQQEKLKYDLNADNRSNDGNPNFEDGGFEVRIEESIKQDKKLVGNAVVNLVRIDETDAFQSYFKNNTINVRHARLYTGTDDKNLTISMTDKETIVKAESNTAESNDTTYIDSENITVEAKEIELTGSIKPENTENTVISDGENINPTAETELTNSLTMSSAKPMIKTDAEEFDPVEPDVIPPVKIRKQCLYKSNDLIPALDGIPETILGNPYNMEASSRISDDENINPTAENTKLTNSQIMNSAKQMIKTDAEEIDPVEPEAIPPVKIRKQCIYKSNDLIPALDGIPETILSNPYNMEASSRISDDENINPTAENTKLTNSEIMNSAKPMIKTDAEEIDPVEPEAIPPVKIRKQCIYKSNDLTPALDGIPETILSNPYNMEASSRISDDENINPTAENTKLTNSQIMNSAKPMIKTDAEEIDPVEPEAIPPMKIRKKCIYKSNDLITALDGIPETILSNPYNTETSSRISDDENINLTVENTKLTNSQIMNSAKPMIKTDAEEIGPVEPEAIPPVKIRKKCIYKSNDLITALDRIPETILSNPYNMEALTLIKPVVVRLKENDRLKPRRVVRKVELPYIDEVLQTNKGMLTAKVAPIRIRKCLSAWESYTPDLQEHMRPNWTYLAKQVKQMVKKLLIANAIATANSRLKKAKRKLKHKHNKQNKTDDKKKKKEKKKKEKKKKKKEKKKMEKKKSSEIIRDPTDELNRQKTNNDMFLTTDNINSLKDTRDASKPILNSRERNNGCENYQKKRCEKRKMSDVIEWEKYKRKLQEHFNASDIHKSPTKTKDKRKVCNVESGVNQKDLNVFEYHMKYRKKKLKNIRFNSDPIKEWETQKSKIKNLATVSTSNIKTSLPTEKQSDSSVPTKEEKHTRDYLEEWKTQKKHFGMDDPNDTSNEQISVDPGNALKELTPCDAKQSNNETEKKALKDKERKKTENQKEQQAKKNCARNPLEEWEIEKNKYKKYFTIGDFGKSEPKKLPKTANKINEPIITELKLMQVGSQIDAATRNNTTFNKGDVNSTSEPTKSYKNPFKLVQESSQICFQNGNITFNIEAVNRASKALIQDKTELKMVQAGSQTDAKKKIQATFNENNVNKTSKAVRQDKTELEVVQEGSQDAEKKNMIFNICDVNRISKAIQQKGCQIDSEKENITFNIYDVNGTTEAVRQDRNKWKLLLQESEIDAEKRNNMTINISDVSRTSEAVRQDKIELKLMQEGSKLDFEKGNMAFKILCDVNSTTQAVRQDKTELKLVQEERPIDAEKRINTLFNICDVNSTSKEIQDKFKLNMAQEEREMGPEKGNMTFNIGDVQVNKTSPPTGIGTESWSKLQASPSLGRAPRPAVGRYNCNQPNRTFVIENRRLITPDRRGSINYLKTNTSVNQNYHKECTNTTQKPTPSQILFHPMGVDREGNEIDLLIDEMKRKISGLCGSTERHHIFDPFLKNVPALDANGCAYVKPLESIKEKSILQKNKMLASMLERKQPILASSKKSVNYLEDMSFQKKNQILPSFEPIVNSSSKQHVLEVPEKPLDLSKDTSFQKKNQILPSFEQKVNTSSKQHVFKVPEKPLDLSKVPDKSSEKLKTLQSLRAHEISGISSAGTDKSSSDQTKQSTPEPMKFTAYPKDPSLEKLKTLRCLLLADTNVTKTLSPRKDNTSRDQQISINRYPNTSLHSPAQLPRHTERHLQETPIILGTNNAANPKQG